MYIMGGELTIRDRIKFVLSQKNLSIAEFAGGNDTLRIKITRQLNGTSDVGLNVVELFIRRFPDVSAEWLLRGEGTIDKSGHFAPHIHAGSGSIVQGGHNSGDAMISTPSQFELYGKDVVISSKDAEISILNQMVTELKRDKDYLQGLLQAITRR